MQSSIPVASGSEVAGTVTEGSSSIASLTGTPGSRVACTARPAGVYRRPRANSCEGIGWGGVWLTATGWDRGTDQPAGVRWPVQPQGIASPSNYRVGMKGAARSTGPDEARTATERSEVRTAARPGRLSARGLSGCCFREQFLIRRLARGGFLGGFCGTISPHIILESAIRPSHGAAECSIGPRIVTVSTFRS